MSASGLQVLEHPLPNAVAGSSRKYRFLSISGIRANTNCAVRPIFLAAATSIYDLKPFHICLGHRGCRRIQ